jgi:hypothetical protein
MTDLERDELLSDVLDGTATAAEMARVAADPVLAARLALLEGLADDLGSVPAAPTGVLDAQIGAALDAFGGRDAGAAAGTPHDDMAVAPVVALRSRPLFSQPLARAAALIAIVGALGGVIGLAGLGRDSSTDTAATVAAEATTDGADLEAKSAAGANDDAGFGGRETEMLDDPQPGVSDAGAMSSNQTAGPFRLVYGDPVAVADLDELVDHLRGVLEDSADRDHTTEAPPGAPDCSIWVDVRERSQLRFEGDVTLNGVPRRVFVLGGQPDVVLVVDLTECELTDSVEL